MAHKSLLSGYRDATGRVEVECWCGGQWMRVPVALVRAGKTVGCTKYHCAEGDVYHGPPMRGRPRTVRP